MKQQTISEEENQPPGSCDIVIDEEPGGRIPSLIGRVSPLSSLKVETPPEKSQPKLWHDNPSFHWKDWQWQMANRLTSLESLSMLLGLHSLQKKRYERLIETFRYSITPYYLSLIDWSDPNDPVRKQCVPDLKELEFHVSGVNDPLDEEEDMQVPGLVHRYPDRVLAILTSMCSMYCRHCTRKRIWKDGQSTRTEKELAAMAAYVKRSPEVREVIISGGDPLTMNIELLDWFMGELTRIPHVEVLRIGTRVPVVLPMRITDDMVKMLASHRPLWVNTQFNHPKEITDESREACDRLLRAGIPVSNQTVLLKGINDSPELMKKLVHDLQRIMVRPYYLFQCDPVTGVEHFRTDIWKGIEIIEMLRGHTVGLCVPTFVIDAPGGGGKVPLQPFYLLSANDREIVLRNYENMIIRYENPKEPAISPGNGKNRNGRGTGANQFIHSTGNVSVPQETPRMKRRRRKHLIHQAGGGIQ